jgi:hypothetical protein
MQLTKVNNDRAVLPIPHKSSWCNAYLIMHRGNFTCNSNTTDTLLVGGSRPCNKKYTEFFKFNSIIY